MDLWTFWQSVAALRRVEFITLVVTLMVPIFSGTVIFTIRHRIRSLQSQSSNHQNVFYQENVAALEQKNDSLAEELRRAKQELSALRPLAAGRRITPLQQDILLEKLRGVHAAPVIVAAYAFEEESATYGEQIAAVLRKAHWDVTFNKSSMNDFKGISLGKIDLTNQPVPGLHELAAAFTEARLELRQHPIQTDTIAGALQDGSLLVVVGRK